MDEQLWPATQAFLYVLLKDAAAPVLALRRALFMLPLNERESVSRVHYHPYRKCAHALLHPAAPDTTWDHVAAALEVLGPITLLAEGAPDGYGEEPWVPVKAASTQPGLLQPAAQALNFLPNPVNRLFGGPSPLAASLTGGLLGAGLGYGAGWLGEQFLPEEHFEKGRLRKVLAALGAAGGAAPGLVWGASSYGSNPEKPGMRAFLHGWPFRDQDLMPKQGSIGASHAALYEALGEKCAAGLAGGLGVPPIETDNFNRVVWQDQQTPPDLRAATTGLIESASVLRGGADLISPIDVGRIAVGMGSGWLSGMLVGKTLGALAGLRPETQQKLQQAGTWAGVLANVVPIAYRRV